MHNRRDLRRVRLVVVPAAAGPSGQSKVRQVGKAGRAARGRGRFAGVDGAGPRVGRRTEETRGGQGPSGFLELLEPVLRLSSVDN
jgi:hypothetical protein